MDGFLQIHCKYTANSLKKQNNVSESFKQRIAFGISSPSFLEILIKILSEHRYDYVTSTGAIVVINEKTITLHL